VSERSGQIVICEGCGSSWRVDVGKASVIGKLVECPLCESKEAS
jgi:hypothetical protein